MDSSVALTVYTHKVAGTRSGISIKLVAFAFRINQAICQKVIAPTQSAFDFCERRSINLFWLIYRNTIRRVALDWQFFRSPCSVLLELIFFRRKTALEFSNCPRARTVCVWTDSHNRPQLFIQIQVSYPCRMSFSSRTPLAHPKSSK